MDNLQIKREELTFIRATEVELEIRHAYRRELGCRFLKTAADQNKDTKNLNNVRVAHPPNQKWSLKKPDATLPFFLPR